MSDVLHAHTAADLETRLRSAIETAMHAELKLFVPAGAAFTDPDGNHPINASGVLVTLVSGDLAAMDVDPSDQRTPFRRLSHDEQRWLLALGVVLVVPLHTPDHRLAGLMSLSAKRSGLKYLDGRSAIPGRGGSVGVARARQSAPALFVERCLRAPGA